MKAIKINGDKEQTMLMMDDKLLTITSDDHFLQKYDITVSLIGEDNGYKEAKTWFFHELDEGDTDMVVDRMFAESEIINLFDDEYLYNIFDAIIDCKFAGDLAQTVLEEHGFECEGWE